MWNFRLAALITLALALAGSVWYAYSSGHSHGAAQVQARWTAEKLATAQAALKLLEQATARQIELENKMTQARRKTRHEIDRITAEHAALVDGLRNRPDARAGDPGVPADPAAGVGLAAGCTGAGLAGPDARFLAGAFADAAWLAAAVRQCMAWDVEVRAAQP